MKVLIIDGQVFVEKYPGMVTLIEPLDVFVARPLRERAAVVTAVLNDEPPPPTEES